MKEFSSPPRDAHKDSASLVWALEATAATDLATKGHRDNSVFVLVTKAHKGTLRAQQACNLDDIPLERKKIEPMRVHIHSCIR